MSRFYLQPKLDIKKKILIPIGLFALFFLNTYLLRSPYASTILIAGILFFIIYSIIIERKHYIEFHRNDLEYHKPSGRLVFSESINDLRIRKLEIRFKNVLIGLAVSFIARDGTEISVGTYGVHKKWLTNAETTSKAQYDLNPVKWESFIDCLGLSSELKSLSKNGLEMQQIEQHRAYFQKKIFWWFLMGAGIMLLIFAAMFGWILLRYVVFT